MSGNSFYIVVEIQPHKGDRVKAGKGQVAQHIYLIQAVAENW